MSALLAVPEVMVSAATNLSELGATLSAASAAAAGPTTGVLSAADDEVSTAVAALFSEQGQAFQALSARAAAFHAQFAQTLTAAGCAYAATEAAAVAPLRAAQAQGGLLGAVNATFLAYTGRPLIGNGQPGAAGTGANGGA
ncbi:PE family protein, partial [Mycobacterium bohemicum]